MCAMKLQLVGSLTHRIVIPKECQLVDSHQSEGISLVENNHGKNFNFPLEVWNGGRLAYCLYHVSSALCSPEEEGGILKRAVGVGCLGPEAGSLSRHTHRWSGKDVCAVGFSI